MSVFAAAAAVGAESAAAPRAVHFIAVGRQPRPMAWQVREASGTWLQRERPLWHEAASLIGLAKVSTADDVQTVALRAVRRDRRRLAVEAVGWRTERHPDAERVGRELRVITGGQGSGDRRVDDDGELDVAAQLTGQGVGDERAERFSS
jgi:hypothetical protein